MPIPSGFYQAEGVPYPRAVPPRQPVVYDPLAKPVLPSTPEAAAALEGHMNRAAFAGGATTDAAMRPDTSIGMAPPRDPATAAAMQKLTSAPAAAPANDVTVVQPDRTTAFSDADAQVLQSLDPRALEEARQLAALNKPKTATATYGGKTFQMTAAPRVDRKTLGGVYNKYQQKLAEEKQAKMRSEDYAHKEKLVGIPGEQATQRAQIDANTKMALAKASAEANRPLTEAEVARITAETEAAKQRTEQGKTAFAERITPKQQMARQDAQEALKRAMEAPDADKPAGRMRIAAARKLANADLTAGMSPEDAAALNAPETQKDPLTQLEENPEVQSAIQQAQEASSGMKSYWDPQASAAARLLAEQRIKRIAKQIGMSPTELDYYIKSKIGQ